MELSNEQRELLSAYIDGEVNATERALAEALLKREEAASYVASMRKIKTLAQDHTKSRAPLGFAAMVSQALEGDFDSISRPTSMAPVHAMPAPTWRTPLLAIAAAVLIAIGLLTYNSILIPATIAAPTGVALEQPGTQDLPVLEKPMPASPERARSNREHEKTSKLEKELADEALKTGTSEADGSSPKKDAAGPAPTTKDPSHTGTGKAGKVKDKAGSPTDGKAAPGQPGYGDNWERKDDHAQDEAQAAQTNEATLVVDSSRKGASASVLTDVLQMGCMYGAASLVDTQGETDGVAIVVSEEQMAEVMAALEKLTQEQKLGQLDWANDTQKEPRNEAKDAEEKKVPIFRRALQRGGGSGGNKPDAQPQSFARDYLPSELRGAVEREELAKDREDGDHNSRPDDSRKGEVQPPPTPPTSQPSAPKRMVRLVIRLK